MRFYRDTLPPTTPSTGLLRSSLDPLAMRRRTEYGLAYGREVLHSSCSSS